MSFPCLHNLLKCWQQAEYFLVNHQLDDWIDFIFLTVTLLGNKEGESAF